MTRDAFEVDVVLVGEAGATYETAVKTVLASAADICQGIWGVRYYPTPIEGTNYITDADGAARPLARNIITVVADPSGAMNWSGYAYPLLTHAIAFRYSPALSTDENAEILAREVLRSCHFRGWCDHPEWYHDSTGLLAWATLKVPASAMATNPTGWDPGVLGNRLIWYQYLSEQVRDLLTVSPTPRGRPYTILHSSYIAPAVASRLGQELWQRMAERTHLPGDIYSNTWLKIDGIALAHDYANCYLDGTRWNAASEGVLVPLLPYTIAVAYRNELGSTGDADSSTGPWPGSPTGSVSVVLDVGMTYEAAARRIWRALLDMQYAAGLCEDPATMATSLHFDAWLRINYPGETLTDDERIGRWYQYLNDQVWLGFTTSTQPPPYVPPVPTGEVQTADFFTAPHSGITPLTVYLTPLTTPPGVAWEWRISSAGEHEQVSYAQYPSFTLTEPGYYDVSLWVRTATNVQFVATKQEYIVVSATSPPPPTPYGATFQASAWIGQAPLTVTVTDASVVPGGVQTSLWSFGDTSPPESGLSATHTYIAPGTYYVTHWAFDAAGVPYECSFPIVVSAGPGARSAWYCAAFVATPASGPAPLTVTLVDTSVVPGGVQLGRWWFGDGSAMSVAPTNEVHTFAEAGVYEIVHWVCGTDGVGYLSHQRITVGGTAVVPGTPPEEPEPPTVETPVGHFAVGDRVLWIPALNIIIPLV